MLFELKNKKISRINEKKFNNESEMQNLCEINLNELLGLSFIDSQFTVAKYRFDTLAFDFINKSFVIIEYKNSINSSIVDQGIAYLNTLINNKAEFVLAFNKKFKKDNNKSEFAWENTKVIFIAPEYTKYQKDSIENLPIQLFKISKYNGLICFEKISSNNLSKSSNRNSINYNLSDEIKVYDEKAVFSKIKKDNISDIYHDIDEYILSFSNINTEMKKLYKVYKISNKIFLSLEPYPGVLYLYFNSKYNLMKKYDKKSIGENVSKIGHHSVGDYRIKIKDDSSIGYIKDLIKSFSKHF